MTSAVALRALNLNKFNFDTGVRLKFGRIMERY